jgi:hypothetical protein
LKKRSLSVSIALPYLKKKKKKREREATPDNINFFSLQTPNMIYMSSDGHKSYKACSCLDPKAIWLKNIISTPNACITKLDLSNLKPGKLAPGQFARPLEFTGSAIAKILEPVFSGTSSVRKLNLSGLPLQAPGAKHIADLLARPGCALESLDVSSCLIWTSAHPLLRRCTSTIITSLLHTLPTRPSSVAIIPPYTSC